MQQSPLSLEIPFHLSLLVISHWISRQQLLQLKLHCICTSQLIFKDSVFWLGKVVGNGNENVNMREEIPVKVIIS